MTDTDRPDGDDAPTQTLPAAAPLSAPELTGFPAGIVGAALTVLGVWGLHVLTRGDGVAGAVGWVILLCLAFSALGKGITLLRRALAPLSAVLSASVDGVPPLLRAAAGIIVGAAGIWWVMRGHASGWWAQITGGDSGSGLGWSLPSQLVQVGIMVVAGALLFGGAKVLGKLIFANSGTRQQLSPNHDGGQRWRQWWASHPGLGLTLLAGGGALVFLSGYVVPRVSSWLTGDDPMAALAAITAILTLALLANTWWWRALSGWWAWAHTPNGPGGPTPIGQIYAGAGVLALIGFSATAFGLATFSSYLPQNAATASADPCGDRCGGGGNGQGSYGPDTGNFQPPQMPGQQPDYQGGINQPPLDQNSGISIYNESPGQGGQQIPQQNMGPQTSGQRAAHGEPLPNYGPWQPDAQPPAQAPVQQAPVQQAPQAPQQPAQAPQNPAGQQPAQQAPQQPAQQAPQQPAGQQPAQQNPPQQGQPGQQQPQNPASQQTPQQQPQKEPDTPKKNPMDPTDLATAATRRGSQQAGQQAAQQAGQHGAQQATQQTTQGTQQATQQSAQQSSSQSAQQLPTDMDNKIGNVGDAIDKGASRAAEQASVPKKAEPLRPPWGANQTQLNQAAARSAETLETVAKLGKPLSWVGNGLEAMNGYNEIVNSTRAGKPAVQAVVDVAPKTVGNIAGGWAGAAIGAEWGASAGLIVGGPAGAVIGAGIGAIAGGIAGSEFGEKAGELLSKGLNALLSW
ncbi:Type IV secretory pathway, VirB10 components [Mycobacteroides abscessus subsp. bolletii]|nr:hypothetical protein [Mycobacteroides abscessus]SKG84659.1 Type IV secretory pathway, VirB10 components [Mycobacteroides abscessus subsp. bolletii]SLF45241.1 Type IV secretory pathway, VirB10 components [Mycobacteroides abscessus subsp. bolletii]